MNMNELYRRLLDLQTQIEEIIYLLDVDPDVEEGEEA